MSPHLLNLRVLADADIEQYSLLSFEGREAISECFDYRLELIASVEDDLSTWIGKHCEFDVTPQDRSQRIFSGRIYSARRVVSGDVVRVHVQIGPAYQALKYSRATHFVQDRTSVEIFDAMCQDVTGLSKMVSVSPNPPKRGYAVRYDESEYDFLARLLAQDGILFFFAYERGAGTYRHRMIVGNKPDCYIDIAAGPVEFLPHAHRGAVSVLERHHKAASRKHSHVSYNVNKLDTPFVKASSAADTWGAVYAHPHETIGYEAMEEGDVGSRQTATDQWQAQFADQIEGRSTETTFMAGGRVELIGGGTTAPKKVVLTSVLHSVVDPWMLPGAVPGEYHNSFTAIDARFVYRPRVGAPHRVAPGPILGVVANEGAAQGVTVVDGEARVPVEIANARDYSPQGLNKVVWLPVKQQWAHSTHGAQFFPRIGTRVIIEFLYGNPDLPFISGTVYSPSQPYPFKDEPIYAGWRSITDGNGAIVQEFRFDDRPGSEEIWLYTGRDYRRVIDNDDWGTVKRNQTLLVEKDRKRTVNGTETVDITQTRTVTVQQKNLLESMTEIEIKVGSSSIKLTPSAIEIKADKIKIDASQTLDMKAGTAATFKSAKIDVIADGPLTLKGGIVMIN